MLSKAKYRRHAVLTGAVACVIAVSLAAVIYAQVGGIFPTVLTPTNARGLVSGQIKPTGAYANTSMSAMVFGEYTGPVVGPLLENDGYYARFTGEPFKSMNWNTARLYAESLFIRRGGKLYKGFLATPNTISENAFIKSRLAPNEDWIGMYQAPRPRSPEANWWFLNNRTVGWNGWGSGEPDDQKNGAITRCTLLSFFTGVTYTSNGDSSSFGVSTNESLETGCENCGMMRADGKWKDKECKSHGNGFLVEFRNL